MKNWSDKQQAIFSWFESISVTTTRHLVVRARAGTGKTTTIIEALKYVPEGLSVLVAAFGKNIQLELESRLIGTKNVQAKTLHSIGLRFVKMFWPDVRINYSNEREMDLANRVCGATAPDAIKKLVAKLATKGRLIVPHAAKLGELTDVALEFECEPDEEWAVCSVCGLTREACTDNGNGHMFGGFDLEYVETKALEAMELAASEKPVRTGIDGADMLYLPVRNHWLRKIVDVVIVDEAQDMNRCQLEIAMGASRGPVIVVGDDRQAIYGFAGADSGSLDRLKAALKADELPLNVTYRCGKQIVCAAQEIVPDYVAAPTNPNGSIESLPMDKLVATATAGDFVLSRVNAPLVSIAMSLLRSGKRTRIAGQNIGEGLVSLVRQLKARTIPELLRKLTAWEDRELSRLKSKFKGREESPAYAARVDGIRDKAAMLASLTDGAPNVTEVVTRIEALFTDDGLGAAGVITCSSVHRAKGLEANRVFILQNTIRDHSEEERNIKYVAITRAKQTLVWVF